jgi:hypothetical protein
MAPVVHHKRIVRRLHQPILAPPSPEFDSVRPDHDEQDDDEHSSAWSSDSDQHGVELPRLHQETDHQAGAMYQAPDCSSTPQPTEGRSLRSQLLDGWYNLSAQQHSVADEHPMQHKIYFTDQHHVTFELPLHCDGHKIRWSSDSRTCPRRRASLDHFIDDDAPTTSGNNVVTRNTIESTVAVASFYLEQLNEFGWRLADLDIVFRMKYAQQQQQLEQQQLEQQ